MRCSSVTPRRCSSLATRTLNVEVGMPMSRAAALKAAGLRHAHEHQRVVEIGVLRFTGLFGSLKNDL